MTQTIDPLDKVMDHAAAVVQAAIPATAIFLLLDESTSMESVRDETITGVNDLLDEQAKGPGFAYFSLTKFASRTDSMGAPVEISQFPKLDRTSYKPNGNTALYDAIGLTIERAEEWFAHQSGPVQVLFVILTDGQENNSSDYHTESIRRLISKKQEDKWDFVFLGANQDAILAAGAMGIRPKMAANYSGTQAGTKKAFTATSAALRTYRGAGGQSVDTSFYNETDIGE